MKLKENMKFWVSKKGKKGAWCLFQKTFLDMKKKVKILGLNFFNDKILSPFFRPCNLKGENIYREYYTN